MNPTDEEIRSFDTIAKVAAFCNMPADVLDELCNVTGVVKEDHPRAVAEITRADFDAIMPSARLGEGDARGPLSLGQVAKVRLLHTITMYSVVERPAEIKRNEEDRINHVRALAIAQAGDTQVGSTSGVVATTIAVPTVAGVVSKTSLNILDQSKAGEVQTLSTSEVATAFDKYHLAFGGQLTDATRKTPLPAHEPSVDQLTAMSAQLKLDSCWADFATWGPYSDRSRKEREFHATAFDAEGHLQKLRLYGPSSYESWECCFTILTNVLIMLGCVGATDLHSYLDVIKSFHLRFGPSCWGLLYQADYRGRGEYMTRLHRQGVAELRVATAIGPQAEALCWFKTDTQWTCCFNKLARDTDYWTNNFREPAVMVASKAASQLTFLGEDTRVAAAPFGVEMPTRAGDDGSTAAASSARRLSNPPPPSQSGKRRRDEEKKKDKQDLSEVADGRYVKNRRGSDICRNFNEGTCPGTQSGPCPTDLVRRHQCWDCLGNHAAGSSRCSGSTASRGRKVYGKGSTGRGGEGGRRGRG